MRAALSFMLLFLVIGLFGCEQHPTSPSASVQSSLAPESRPPDLEQRVGQKVVLEGVVSASKCPQVQGVDVWELEDYRGQKVRVTGVLRKEVVTQAQIDALKTPDGFPLFATRGPGTFYSLGELKYELLK
jgi:hypothetical protein